MALDNEPTIEFITRAWMARRVLLSRTVCTTSPMHASHETTAGAEKRAANSAVEHLYPHIRVHHQLRSTLRISHTACGLLVTLPAALPTRLYLTGTHACCRRHDTHIHNLHTKCRDCSIIPSRLKFGCRRSRKRPATFSGPPTSALRFF